MSPGHAVTSGRVEILWIPRYVISLTTLAPLSTQTMNGAITRNCGIEVFGINLASPTEDNITYVKQALANHGCVYFRDTVLTPEEHLSFAQNLAPININRYFPHLPRLPAIALVEKKKEQGSSIGERFHADHTYDMAPALGSVLVARELPEKGGDTVFVDMQKAYASLPDDIKQRLVGLRAVHSSRHIFGKKHKDSKTGEHMYNENTMHLATQDTVRRNILEREDCCGCCYCYCCFFFVVVVVVVELLWKVMVLSFMLVVLTTSSFSFSSLFFSSLFFSFLFFSPLPSSLLTTQHTGPSRCHQITSVQSTISFCKSCFHSTF